MIAIIDYGSGNLRSVEKGFQKADVNVKVTNKSEDINKADGVVLPGVGAFRDCIEELKKLELIDAVLKAIKEGKPYLGICLGLQVLFSESEEFGICKGLDVFKGKVVRFDFGNANEKRMSFPRNLPSKFSVGVRESRKKELDSPVKPENDGLEYQPLKVPHMGWNEIILQKENNPLFKDIPNNSYFYFVHSFYVIPEDKSIIATTTDYGIEFTSSVRKDNVFGVQFHPEKSQAAGLQMLKNFGDIVKKGL